MQVTVYDLGALYTSHLITMIQITYWVKTILLKISSNLFEWFWKITKHTDVADKTSKWRMKFKCTLALKLDTLKQYTHGNFK